MKPVLLFLFTIISLNVLAQVKPGDAGVILANAYQAAKKEKKNVLVIFHASWCGWCHRMDSSINDQACKALFDKNYVIRHLVVYENEKNKHLENPGAVQLLERYKGLDQGIPYWIVFDDAGHYLGDSQLRTEGSDYNTIGKNTGCPATAEEVAHFVKMLQKTSSLTSTELQTITTVFRRNEL
jgi:thiol-disulfide isomerase/thioredoxin